MTFPKTLLLLAAGSTLLLAQPPAASDAQIERGRYLTVEVGRCQECHSPRLENREFDKERWLKGAVLEYAPIQPIQGWHKTSPDITSTSRLWKRWGDAGMLKFLTTGVNPGGHPADAPMPAYKLKTEDAEAVIAYLKSLQ